MMEGRGKGRKVVNENKHSFPDKPELKSKHSFFYCYIPGTGKGPLLYYGKPSVLPQSGSLICPSSDSPRISLTPKYSNQGFRLPCAALLGSAKTWHQWEFSSSSLFLSHFCLVCKSCPILFLNFLSLPSATFLLISHLDSSWQIFQPSKLSPKQPILWLRAEISKNISLLKSLRSLKSLLHVSGKHHSVSPFMVFCVVFFVQNILSILIYEKSFGEEKTISPFNICRGQRSITSYIWEIKLMGSFVILFYQGYLFFIQSTIKPFKNTAMLFSELRMDYGIKIFQTEYESWVGCGRQDLKVTPRFPAFGVHIPSPHSSIKH